MPRRLLVLSTLVAAVVLAAWLRFESLGEPSYWLDELLGHDLTTAAAAQPLWKWLTGFEAEHGPLYYATQLSMRVFGSDEAAGRAAAALFGVLTVPLVWLVARSMTSVSRTSDGSRTFSTPPSSGLRPPSPPAMRVEKGLAMDLPPRSFSPHAETWGEKVPKADEGGEAQLRRRRRTTLRSLLMPVIPSSRSERSERRTVEESALARLSQTTASGWNLTAAAAAFLLATSPLHVYYSREARPYALLMLLTALLLIALLRASVRMAVAGVVAVAYTTAVGGPLVVAVAMTALCGASVTKDARRRRSYWIIAAVSACALPLFSFIYHGEPSIVTGLGFPPLDRSFFDALLRSFSVTALGASAAGRTAWLLFVFACIGVVSIVRRDRVAGIIVGCMAVLPVVLGLGALRYLGHWYAVRYVCPALIAYVVAASMGIVATTRVAAIPLRSWPRAAGVLSSVLTAAVIVVIAVQTWPATRREAFQKLDWRAIAKVIAGRAQKGDVVLAAEPWSQVSLRFYLRRLPHDVRLIAPESVAMADILAREANGAWLVTAGFSRDASQREWMCRYPVLLSSRLENFRLHYAPSLHHFVTKRGSAAERRTFATAMSARQFSTTMDASDDLLFGEGWGDTERAGDDTFRWMTSRSASLIVPAVSGDRFLRMRVIPYAPAARAPQSLRVSINGAAIGTYTLENRWSELSVAVPERVWKRDMNELTFEAAHAIAPAEVEASSADRRPLAVAFDWVTVATGASGSDVRPERFHLETVHLATEPLLDEKTAWRNHTRGRFPAARLRRDQVENLVARVGFDPVYVWRRLAEGRVRLEDVVETTASGSDCEGDRAFLERVFAQLLERRPNAIEERDLLQRLRGGATREHIVSRIMRSDDFRALVLLP